MKDTIDKIIVVQQKLVQSYNSSMKKLADIQMSQEDSNAIHSKLDTLLNLFESNSGSDNDDQSTVEPQQPGTNSGDKTPVFNVTIIKTEVPDVPEWSIQNGLAEYKEIGDYYDTGQLYEYISIDVSTMPYTEVTRYAKKYKHVTNNIIAYYHICDDCGNHVKFINEQTGSSLFDGGQRLNLNIETASSGETGVFYDSSPYTFQLRMY